MSDDAATSDSGASGRGVTNAVLEDAVGLNPFSALRTAGWYFTCSDKLPEAVRKQKWHKVTSPAKYFGLCVLLFGFTLGLLAGSFKSEQASDDWSFTSPFFWKFGTSALLPCVLSQTIWIHLNSKIPNLRFLDCSAMIIQVWAYALGSILLYAVPIEIMQHFGAFEEGAIPIAGWIPVAIVLAIGFLVSFLLAPSNLFEETFLLGEGEGSRTVFLGLGAGLVIPVILHLKNGSAF